ncbi:DUF4352 domain-containing protein [Halobacillus seohaensis]|uniref:DUF4352 domain-containing protein n=1 Tax=Halobacillus seohaensis TaxID=447421 RepID=A0ABW2EQM3_9BACI
MKRFIMLFFISILLVGCSTQNSSNESHAQEDRQDKDNIDEKIGISDKQKYVNNPQASDDRNLKEVGDTSEDENGELSLKAIKAVEENMEIGPMQLTVEDVKVLNYFPSPDLIDFFHAYSHNEMNFNYIKFRVSVENTADEQVNFAPVSVLETDQGEKKDFKDDFYLENLYGDYDPGEERIGDLGFVIDETKPKELEFITITTSDVFAGNGTTIADGRKITIEF